MFLRLLHVAAKLNFNTNRVATQYQQDKRGARRGTRHNLKNKMRERCVEGEGLSQQIAGPHKGVPGVVQDWGDELTELLHQSGHSSPAEDRIRDDRRIPS